MLIKNCRHEYIYLKLFLMLQDVAVDQVAIVVNQHVCPALIITVLGIMTGYDEAAGSLS